MNKRHVLRFLSLAIIFGIVLAACQQTNMPEAQGQPTQPIQATEPTSLPQGDKKVTTFIWTQEIDTLNPLYTNMWFSTATHQLWNCWTWEYNEKNEAFPKLITELPRQENGRISADGLTITMTLRDDIRWSDNTPITADDFQFTYQMAVEPKNTVASSYPYDRLKEILTPDELTVVMVFSELFAPWEATFWKGILPAHILRPVFEARRHPGQCRVE